MFLFKFTFVTFSSSAIRSRQTKVNYFEGSKLKRERDFEDDEEESKKKKAKKGPFGGSGEDSEFSGKDDEVEDEDDVDGADEMELEPEMADEFKPAQKVGKNCSSLRLS